MGHLSHLLMLTIAGVVFNGILWARNYVFLWRHKNIIFIVVGISLLWTFITDPIGGYWGAWFFDPNKVIGIWILTVVPIEDFLGNVVVSSSAASAILVFGYSPQRRI